MANTTLGNLKKGALQRAGNHYNSNDSALLELAGGVMNDVMGWFQVLLGQHPYVLDLANTVNTVAAAEYVDLVDTDILEVLQVYQRVTDSKLINVSRTDFVGMVPDTTAWGGMPDLVFSPTQTLNASGQNIWRIYLVPTPADIQVLYYDYIKNIQFSSVTADAEFSPFPSTFDEWIYAEFKPRFYEAIDPKGTARINSAYANAERVGSRCRQYIISPKDGHSQMGSYGNRTDILRSRVADTADPTP